MDLKTIVRNLKEESLAQAQSHQAPLKSTVPRQKRWATKTKTGCATCRGYAPDSASSSKAVVLAPRANHPDWDIMDAIKYYGAVMLKDEVFHNFGDGLYVTSFKPDLHIEKITSRESFIALVVTDRIVNASAQAGVLPRQGELPSINHLWSLLYRHIDIVIKDLNSRIAGGAAIETLLRRLVDLLSIDLSVMDPAWRSHVEGFAAMVKLHGGVQKVLSVKAKLERDQRVPPMALHYVLIYSTLANTASPASNQISGLSNWSPDDVAAAYSHTGFHPAPCPTCVLQDIIRITRLRTMCLAEPTITSAFVPIAREVSRLLATFDPEEWTEPYSTPDAPCVPLAGDMYKIGAILYGILSLPPVLAAEFAFIPGASPIADDATIVENGRVYYARYLFGLVNRAVEELPRPQGICWPIAVLGVAMHDAPQEEKDLLLAHLKVVRAVPGADSGAANIDIKLRDFCFLPPILEKGDPGPDNSPARQPQVGAESLVSLHEIPSRPGPDAWFRPDTDSPALHPSPAAHAQRK
ncbi:hypothetical protein NLG97_g645 [Lecanicillium saksenae]|uniref:Uncharacterized protein n=1 Tax=Lecanicillium saksenae TaxID=468837 RepID=A0ACC1R9D9_9HYPO|nr:hypothetical protein NLG97_g645 [Lecanicillium saksenae]